MNRTKGLIVLVVIMLGIALFIMDGAILCKIDNLKQENMGVVYLTDYNANLRAQHLDEVCEGYAQLLHRIWIDEPVYVEEALMESDEFWTLDSLMEDWGDIFEYWSDEDSVLYHHNWIGEPDIPSIQPPKSK